MAVYLFEDFRMFRSFILFLFMATSVVSYLMLSIFFDSYFYNYLLLSPIFFRTPSSSLSFSYSCWAYIWNLIIFSFFFSSSCLCLASIYCLNLLNSFIRLSLVYFNFCPSPR